MSRRDETKIGTTGVAQALAELKTKYQAMAVELEALAQQVEVEAAAAQEREAEQTARLGEALSELAEAKAAVVIEKQKRIEAEEFAAGLAAAVEVIKAVAARFPSAIPGTDRDAANDAQVVAAVPGEATQAAVPPAEAAPDGGTPDSDAAEDEEHRVALADAEQETVSIVVKLSPAEAAALEALAARDGNGGGVDAAAADFIRDGLRRSGWRPAADENRSRRE